MSVSPPSSGLPAGWYPDPADESAVRWWTGESWTTNVAERSADESAAPRAMRSGGRHESESMVLSIANLARARLPRHRREAVNHLS